MLAKKAILILLMTHSISSLLEYSFLLKEPELVDSLGFFVLIFCDS